MQETGTTDPPALFQTLADEYARAILVAADQEWMTAKALSQACDASLSTVYRRLATLDERGLVEERTTVDSDRTHRREYKTSLERLSVEVSDGAMTVTLETRDELADSFTALWSDIRGETSGTD